MSSRQEQIVRCIAEQSSEVTFALELFEEPLSAKIKRSFVYNTKVALEGNASGGGWRILYKKPVFLSQQMEQ